MVFMAKNSSNILTATLFDVNWWENCSWNCQKMSFFYSDLQIMALTYLLALLFSMRPSWKYIDLALFDVENLGREDLFELLYEAATWASVPNLFNKIFGNIYKKWWQFQKFHVIFCRNSKYNYTVWKVQHFTWNQFWRIWSKKNAIFAKFRVLNFSFGFSVVRASKYVKMAVF